MVNKLEEQLHYVIYKGIIPDSIYNEILSLNHVKHPEHPYIINIALAKPCTHQLEELIAKFLEPFNLYMHSTQWDAKYYNIEIRDRSFYDEQRRF